MPKKEKGVRNFILSLVAFVMIVSVGLGQSVEFSQPYFNLVYTNPAFAGTNVCPRLFVDSRLKNVSYEQSYKTALASYDQAYRKWNVDGGLIVKADEQGEGYRDISLSPIIAKAINISKKSVLRLAFQFDVQHQTYSESNVTYSDMVDPVYGFVFQTSEPQYGGSRFSFGATSGVLYYTNSTFFGVAVHNIVPLKGVYADGNVHVSRKISGHIGQELNLGRGRLKSKSFKLFPAIYVQHEKRYNLTQGGLVADYQGFLIGLYGRVSDFNSFESLSPIIGFHQKKFKFAYSGDFYVVGHKEKEFDTHEISLTFYLPCGAYTPKQKSIGCPGH